MKLEELNEVKSGRFKSKAIGNRVKVTGTDDFGNSDHSGEIGTIINASREPTFSAMHPWVIVYSINLDNGKKVSYRRERVTNITGEKK